MIKAMVDIRDEDVLSLVHVLSQFMRAENPDHRAIISRGGLNTITLRIEKWGPKKGWELASETYFYSNSEIYEYLWRKVRTYMPGFYPEEEDK